MLNNISWGQYVATVIILSGTWYTYAVLRYYRSKLLGFLKIRAEGKGAVPPFSGPMPDVMGTVRPEPGDERFDPEELIFSSATTDEASDQTLPRGPADELLEEARSLVAAFEGIGDKAEFISLLKLLLNKYEVFADEISLPVAIATLKRFADIKLPFRLKDAEWPQNF